MYKATKNNQGVSRRTFLSSTAAAGVGTLAVELTSRSAEAATQIAAADISKLPRVKQELVAPPFAPKHDQVAKGGPKVVEIRMVIKEKKMVLDDDGTEIWALTYDGWVPGPLVIVHEGDYVELTLVNPASNAMEHNCPSSCNWNKERVDLKEDLAHLFGYVKRRICGIASAWFPLSFV